LEFLRRANCPVVGLKSFKHCSMTINYVTFFRIFYNIIKFIIFLSVKILPTNIIWMFSKKISGGK